MYFIFFILGVAFLPTLSFSQNPGHKYTNPQLEELSNRLAHDPLNLSLYYARAEAYGMMNDFQNANSDYRKVAEIYRTHPEQKYLGEYVKSCYRLADDYFFRSSNREQALKYLTKGLQATRDFKDLEILEAVLLGLDEATRDLAFEKYKSLLEKYRDDVRLGTYYALFLENVNPLEAALQFEKVLLADPFNRKALLSVGTIYNNEAHRLSSGVVNDPGIVYDLAAKASFYFEKLYKLNPDDKEVANMLLRLYDEMGEREKAKKLPAPY